MEILPGSSLLRLKAGGSLYALPLESASEISPLPALTPVPGAPASILGLAEIRGRVVSVLDLGALRAAAAEPSSCREIVSLGSPWSHVALAVERAHGPGESVSGDPELLHPDRIVATAAGQVRARYRRAPVRAAERP